MTKGYDVVGVEDGAMAVVTDAWSLASALAIAADYLQEWGTLQVWSDGKILVTLTWHGPDSE